VPDSTIIVAARPRLKVGIGAAAILILLALAVAVVVSALGPHGVTTRVATPKQVGATSIAGTAAPRSQLYVHLVGAVVHPGLYVLATGDRVLDAVAAAGGFTPEADQSKVNLARALSDGEQVVVPAAGDLLVAGATGPAGIPSNGARVNLNLADVTALETLPRVGPALAARIVEWRKTNGRFTAIEDLMSVTGVGQKTFDGLKELVTV